VVDAKAAYETGREVRSRDVASLESRSRAIASARLTLAAAALALLAGLVWWRLGSPGWAALGAVVVAFVALVLVHARVIEERERASAALRFYERGLARLAHAWDKLPASSERFRSPDHPFSGDLDVFGHASLMQLVDATETAPGEEKLAALLSQVSVRAWPDEILARQGATRDLVSRAAFRETIATAGGVLADEKPSAAPLLSWAEESDRLARPLALVAWVAPGLAIALLVLAPALHLRTGLVTLLVVAEVALGLFFSTRLTPMLSVVSTRESSASRWREMIAAVEREPFEAPLLIGLRDRLTSGHRRASDEIAALARIVGFADARRNEVFRFLIGPFLFWDVHCALALTRWRARAGRHVRAWLEALADVEALASLAAFAVEHPDFVWPELAPEPVLEARSLGHPLLEAEHRVGNDVSLPTRGRALVVTGSNMSGKSTLLRALGINAVLAFAGAPVCARAMRIGPARVATSMRVEDSLEQGVSHFYAELRRLKRVLDRAHEAHDASDAAGGGAGAVLFLLDEILHGTNSRERVIGACAIVRELLALGALGAVSTHDLGITALERELGGRVENVHFEEQVAGDTMTFDFVLRPGVVQSSNALRLMRAVGIDVAHDMTQDA
jgi:hypothetical protein